MSDILIQNNLLYLVPMIVAITLVLVTILLSQRMKHEKLFENESANFLYGLSYLKPFIWFINPNEEDPKVIQTQVKLNQAGLNTKLNYRSFISLQILLMISSVFLYGILFISVEAWVLLFAFLFNLPIEMTESNTMNIRMILAVILMGSLMVPNIVVRMKGKRNSIMFTEDLPLVQLSIILMLRARRPIGDILFELSRTDNRYREIFETSYRMFIRDKSEAYAYLYRQFDGTGFEEAIQVLEQMGEFSKDESITVMENGLQQLIQKGQASKRGKALAGNLASQFSMMLPFGGVMLLGMVPIIVYALSMLNSDPSQPMP